MRIATLRPAHEFLRGHLFYPLALSTALCAVLIVGRVVLSGSYNYAFLVWNLILAWLPYAFALWATRAARARPARRRRLIVPCVLWVLFLPNAAYIMTDFNHLLQPRRFPLMYDIALIFAFAWTGLLLWLASLDLIQGLVRPAFGRAAATAVLLASALLTGAGIYLGRFLRWNSWDVLTRPREMWEDLCDALVDQRSHVLGHTAVFATVVLLCHLTFVALRRQPQRN